MSTYHAHARSEAFKLVPETCPKVDRALGRISDKVHDLVREAEDEIKAQTEALREALIEVIEEKLRLEDDGNEKDNRISELEGRVRELERDLERVS